MMGLIILYSLAFEDSTSLLLYPGLCHWFWFNLLTRSVSSFRTFRFALSNVIALIPHIKKLMWVFHQPVNVSISIMHLKLWEKLSWSGTMWSMKSLRNVLIQNTVYILQLLRPMGYDGIFWHRCQWRHWIQEYLKNIDIPPSSLYKDSG